ncbi:MAG: hypothetical protein HZB55_24310 [Deltaproteobacteria bacterium]|nr:hypothetical protein [Deltaproteobacteria bacterium]
MRRRRSTLCLVVAALLTGATARAGGPRFRALDVVVDAGTRPLAAYQIELTYDRKAISLVGLEGGDPPFAEAPYYDPRGLTAGRVVVASFTLDRSPPRSAVRVARVHLAERTDGAGEITARVTVAGTVGGARIPASLRLIPYEEGGGR